jgi:hypothetical protein
MRWLICSDPYSQLYEFNNKTLSTLLCQILIYGTGGAWPWGPFELTCPRGQGFWGSSGIWGSNAHKLQPVPCPSSFADHRSVAPKSTLVCVHSPWTRFSPHKKEPPMTCHKPSIRYHSPIRHSLSLMDWPQSCLCSLLMRQFPWRFLSGGARPSRCQVV